MTKLEHSSSTSEGVSSSSASEREPKQQQLGERAIEREREQQQQIRLVWTPPPKGPRTGGSRRGDVARGAGFKVVAPWGCSIEHHQRREVELRRRCDAMSV